jgi:hypothetical protein
MRSRYFHQEWGYVAPASAFLRSTGIALVAIAIGATAGVCVVVSLIAASGEDTSLSARHALITAAPVVRPPAISAAPDISSPASASGALHPAPESLSGSQKSAPAVAAVSEAIHVKAAPAPVEQARSKKRVTKQRYAGNRWRDDLIRQRLGLLERLKPQ